MRVGRGGRSVGMTRLGFVARAAAKEVHAASASNPQALHEFLRSFAADLQPAPGIAPRTMTPTLNTSTTNMPTSGRPNPRGPRSS
jgi:hypothetical protein